MVIAIRPWLPRYVHGYRDTSLVTAIRAWLPRYVPGYRDTSMTCLLSRGQYLQVARRWQ